MFRFTTFWTGTWMGLHVFGHTILKLSEPVRCVVAECLELTRYYLAADIGTWAVATAQRLATHFAKFFDTVFEQPQAASASQVVECVQGLRSRCAERCHFAQREMARGNVAHTYLRHTLVKKSNENLVCQLRLLTLQLTLLLTINFIYISLYWIKWSKVVKWFFFWKLFKTHQKPLTWFKNAKKNWKIVFWLKILRIIRKCSLDFTLTTRLIFLSFYLSFIYTYLYTTLSHL